MHRLQAKDLSLTTSMIPLGSCTMKLNATAEMFPVTWPEFGGLHPFAPSRAAAGLRRALRRRSSAGSCEITGFAAVSLQPNAGSQGEYAGLLVIREYHRARGEGKRNVCLIPQSAHGTNPASAVMAGMKVVVTACDAKGNVDVADLKAKAVEHKDRLAALMITYPSTHGVFEESIREICDVDPRERRPGLHGRREHERAGRPVPAGRLRPRRLPPEPPQDVLHPARRRRPGHGPDRRRGAPRALPPGAPRRAHGRHEGDRPRLGGAVRQPARSS